MTELFQRVLRVLDDSMTDDRLFAKWEDMRFRMGKAVATDIFIEWFSSNPNYASRFPHTYNTVTAAFNARKEAMDAFDAFLRSVDGHDESAEPCDCGCHLAGMLPSPGCCGCTPKS